MTRFALFAFALFTSACAADVDANLEDSSDELRASIEGIDTDTERVSRDDRNQRVVRALVKEYGPLAKRYDCDIAGVLTASWRDRSAPIKARVMDTNGAPAADLVVKMRSTGNGEGVIYGKTVKSRLNNSDYNLRGMFEGHAIDADMVPSAASANAQNLQVFGDWTPRGSGGFMKGIVAECE